MVVLPGRREASLAQLSCLIAVASLFPPACSAQGLERHHPDPYETLHVSKDSGVEDIKTAYHDVTDGLTSEEKLAEVVEAYQEVLDHAYAEEQSLTYEEAHSVNVVVSNDRLLSHVAGGGGYGVLAVGAAAAGGPRLCMVMYKSQRWRWGLRWDSQYSVVGGGEDRGGPYTTHGEYDQDRRVRWVKHYVETRREILYEGVKEGDVIKGTFLDVNSGKRGAFEFHRAH